VFPSKLHVFITKIRNIAAFCCNRTLEQLAIWSMSMGRLAWFSSGNISLLRLEPFNALIIFYQPSKIGTFNRTLKYSDVRVFKWASELTCGAILTVKIQMCDLPDQHHQPCNKLAAEAMRSKAGQEQTGERVWIQATQNLRTNSRPICLSASQKPQTRHQHLCQNVFLLQLIPLLEPVCVKRT
jgi:hypothetical protein